MAHLEWNFGQAVKVSMARVSEHCNMPPYLKLVRQCIKRGNGFVILIDVNDHTGMAHIAGNAYDALLGTVQVPVDSLIG